MTTLRNAAEKFESSQTIKNVAIIDGKPYGRDCAARVLGLKELPVWYTGGDYTEEKRKFDESQIKADAELEQAKANIIEFWDDCMALKRVRDNGNDWVKNFVNSISRQLGLILGWSHYKTAEEHIKNTPYLLMTWYPGSNAKHIDTLSEKQLNVLYKNGL